MGLEAATFIEDFVVANPPGSDGKSQGDDHLRLIKTVLKATFPLAIAARKFRNDDAGAADTLAWLLYRKSATPAASDLLGSYAVSGDSSTAVERVYARWQAQIISPTNGAETGRWRGLVMSAGVETLVASLDATGASFPFLLDAGRPPTMQSFTVSGTWTKPAGCKKIIAHGSGAGGGSGGVDGQGVGTAGASGGGGGGFSGWSAVIDVTPYVNAAVTIGNGGTAGAAGANAGGDGGLTRLNLGGGAILCDWLGGDGSPGFTANSSSNGCGMGGLGGLAAGTLFGGSHNGHFSSSEATAGAGQATGGDGGSSDHGRGGQGAHTVAAAAEAGGAPSLQGGGGGGSATNNTVTNIAGRAGADGYIRIYEFY